MDAVTATSVTAESARKIVHGETESDVLADAKRAVPLAEWFARYEPLEICIDAVFPPPLPLMGHVTVTQCVAR